MKLRYVCAQPTSLYYAWQVEVMLNNFIDIGVELENVEIVCWKINNQIPIEWRKLQSHFANANFSFYDDTRSKRGYISSIRPNILKQHFIKFPELEKDAIFYHDCDIVFTKPVDWSKFLDDDKWYGSDTRFYISHSYIIGKGSDIMDKMCEIADISESVIKENELNCIGAQYLMKGIDWNFWANVEDTCERLFSEITAMNNQKKMENPSYHELQIWCADMWAVLWHGWKRGKETICHPDFEFAWATSTEADWNKLNIFHNAGVVSGSEGLFYKGEWMAKLPYNQELVLRDGTASKKYWEIIQETAKKSCLL